jgi:hypothetical protein
VQIRAATGRGAVAARNIYHLAPVPGDDPPLGLGVLRPAPPLHPFQHLDPHRPTTLKLGPNSNASQNTGRRTNRVSEWEMQLR